VRLVVGSLAADVLLCLFAHQLALAVFAAYHDLSPVHYFLELDWGVVLALIVVVVTYLWLGLYKLEAYVSRPMHVMLIARGVIIATVVTAFFSFVLKSALIVDSRLLIFVGFSLFFVLDVVARVALLDKAYQGDVRRRPGETILIAGGSTGWHLAARCGELRGFARPTVHEPRERPRSESGADPSLLRAIAAAEPAPRQVILDAPSLGYEAIFELIAAGRARGADVYIAGRTLGPLDVTRLLVRLFEMPVMRVHRIPDPNRPITWEKRAFAVVAACAALVLLAPLFGIIALLIRHDSPGPVFFRQTRVGWRGREFQFFKFRSMKADNDAIRHREATRSFIAGEWASDLQHKDAWGRSVYKLTDDDRVTRVGRVLRKYSLDELPQLWNVLRGDMSMVGPRPPLDYEVEQYKPWHHRRLDVVPGISGLWQVAGRSRVDFDEMVFQDVIYGYNEGLLTDISLCLRTVPVALMGRGAA
jgi:exopolysaccharide biosynthesis polyprenyl glycosylphosphotransferase